MTNDVELSSMIEKMPDKFYACKACGEYKAKRRCEVKQHLLSKHQQLNIECPNQPAVVAGPTSSAIGKRMIT